jgi:hypothetical protein
MSGVYRSEQNNRYATGYANIDMLSAKCTAASPPPMECPASYLSFAAAVKESPSKAPPSSGGYNSLMAAYGPAQPVSYYAQYAPSVPQNGGM